MIVPRLAVLWFQRIAVAGIATSALATVVFGCSGATETRTGKRPDVFDSGAGGATETGGASGSGGMTRPSDGGRGAGPANAGAGGDAQVATSDAARDGTSPKVDATDATTPSPDAQGVDCANSATCPSEWCQIECCPGPGECAPCCVPKMCQGFDAATCPLERCQLLPSCAGPPLCYPPFSGPPPTCGVASYYGADVPCCSGLVKRCGEVASDGTCDPSAGGYQGIPWCLACGDGNCETTFENRCNCPEDCH